MSEYTKGPWRTEYSKSALFLTAVLNDRNCFANCMQEHRTLYGPEGSSEFIADIAVKCDDEGQSNLNLIAAAPDMYEALQGYIEAVDGIMSGSTDRKALALYRMRQALAKAEGKS